MTLQRWNQGRGEVKLLIKTWRVQEKEGLEMITKIPLLKMLGSIGNEAHFSGRSAYLEQVEFEQLVIPEKKRFCLLVYELEY